LITYASLSVISIEKARSGNGFGPFVRLGLGEIRYKYRCNNSTQQ
jgi:hypothetical protein